MKSAPCVLAPTFSTKPDAPTYTPAVPSKDSCMRRPRDCDEHALVYLPLPIFEYQADSKPAPTTVDQTITDHSGNAGIMSYVLTATSPGNPTVTVRNASDSVLDGLMAPVAFNVTGLRNGQPYTFIVQACNAVGCSDASKSKPSAPFTPKLSCAKTGSLQDGGKTCKCTPGGWQGVRCDVCRPDRGYWGPQCLPCPGLVDNSPGDGGNYVAACSGHGECACERALRCDGAAEPGKCSCDLGWAKAPETGTCTTPVPVPQASSDAGCVCKCCLGSSSCTPALVGSVQSTKAAQCTEAFCAAHFTSCPAHDARQDTWQSGAIRIEYHGAGAAGSGSVAPPPSESDDDDAAGRGDAVTLGEITGGVLRVVGAMVALGIAVILVGVVRRRRDRAARRGGAQAGYFPARTAPDLMHMGAEAGAVELFDKVTGKAMKLGVKVLAAEEYLPFDPATGNGLMRDELVSVAAADGTVEQGYVLEVVFDDPLVAAGPGTVFIQRDRPLRAGADFTV